MAQVRDDCGRSKVTDLFERIKAAATKKKKPELRGKAEKVFESYESTWSVDEGTEAKQDTVVETVRLRGKSFFLTYNWDFFGKRLPDGVSFFKEAVDLWCEWQRWEAERVTSLAVKETTSTLERSLHSELVGRVHFHWKINLAEALDQVGAAGFEFHGVRPDVRPTVVAVRTDTNKARGASFKEASDRAHFYTWVPKNGTLFSASNYQPWVSYRVLGK